MRKGHERVHSKEVGLDFAAMSVAHEMASVALACTTHTMARLCGHPVRLSAPRALTLTSETTGRLMSADQVCAMIRTPFSGFLEGHVCYLVSWFDAQTIWRIALGHSPEHRGAMEEAYSLAILNIGREMNLNFVKAIVQLSGRPLDVGSSTVSVGILGDLLAEIDCSIVTKRELLAVETSIFDQADEATGYFLCVPESDGMESLFVALKAGKAA